MSEKQHDAGATCGNCAWFRRAIGNAGTLNQGGSCFVSPPAIMLLPVPSKIQSAQQQLTPQSVWPSVHESHGCAKHYYKNKLTPI